MVFQKSWASFPRIRSYGQEIFKGLQNAHSWLVWRIQSKNHFCFLWQKTGLLALLSTDITIADEEMIRLYGKRWDIEVFFKMCKQHLKMNLLLRKLLKDAKSVVTPEVSLIVSAVIDLQAWKKLVGNWEYRFGNISKIELKIPNLSRICQIWLDNMPWTLDNIFLFFSL